MMSHSGSHELVTFAAALAVWVAGGVLVFLSWLRRHEGRTGTPLPASGATTALRTDPRAAARRVDVALAVVVAALSLGAAAIHFAAAAEHVEELGDLGLGFYFAAEFQVAWGLLWLFRRGHVMAWVGIAGNAAIAAAWLWSRLVGLPAGPTPWQPEAVGLADALCTLFQGAIVALLVLRLRGIELAVVRRIRDAAGAATIAAVPAIGIVVIATSIAVGVATAGHEHADASAVHGAAEAGHAAP
ncbi:MAG: hypothetical protein ACJ77B_01360 [Chloroflexota bacterium]